MMQEPFDHHFKHAPTILQVLFRRQKAPGWQSQSYIGTPHEQVCKDLFKTVSEDLSRQKMSCKNWIENVLVPS